MNRRGPDRVQVGVKTALRTVRDQHWVRRHMFEHLDGDLTPLERERFEAHAESSPPGGTHGHHPDPRRREAAEGAIVSVEPFAVTRRRLAFRTVHTERPPGEGDSRPPDEELVRRAQEGDRSAFEELVRRHADRLYGVVIRFCGDATDAEDIVQESFMRAWQSIGRFEARSQFFTWLYRIGLNEAKRKAGRRSREAPVASADDDVDNVADERRTPAGEAERRDVRAALERAVRALPEKYRAPLILRDIEGLTTEEAAAVVGLHEAAFKSRLHRARLVVRKSLRDYDGAEA